MQKTFILSLIVTLALTSAFIGIEKKDRNRFENSVIEMRKEACFGFCPVYSITISGKGKVAYEGMAHVTKKGKFEKQLTPKQISKLFNAFECANFQDFHNEYTSEITDLPTTWISFEHRGYKKTIEDYYNAPEELKELEKMVEEIAFSEDGWKKN